MDIDKLYGYLIVVIRPLKANLMRRHTHTAGHKNVDGNGKKKQQIKGKNKNRNQEIVASANFKLFWI